LIINYKKCRFFDIIKYLFYQLHKALDKFLVRTSNKSRDIKENKKTLVNGLLKHTVSNPEGKLNQLLCKIIHNRDKNAVQNMLKIVEHIKKGRTVNKFISM
jgi:hypothetical protein